MLDLSLALTIVPGLILFLYGIEHFSREILKIAGERFRSILSSVTSNRFGGALLGAIATALVQSSTATTVIAVGLVDAGIMTFAQSVGLIIGANVGTTLTAQLVAFELTYFAPLVILLGFLLSLFGHQYRFLGKPVFYFGLVFFSLNLIAEGIEPLKTDPSALALLGGLSNIFIAIIAGFLFTVLVQSSSVTTGIVVLLVGGGLLTLTQGIPLIMGANIGTSITSVLASFRLSLHAKRAALAHLVFNIGGMLIFLPLIFPFADFIANLGGIPAQQMANAHLIFNVITAAIFLIILKPFSDAIRKLLPGDEEELLFRPKYLGGALPKKNEDACRLIGLEVRRSLGKTKQMFDCSMDILSSADEGKLRKVEKLESFIDYLDDVIGSSILELSKRKLSRKMAKRVVLLVRMSNEVEQLGDLAKNLSIESYQITESGYALSRNSLTDIRKAHSRFSENLALVIRNAPALDAKDRQIIRKNDRILRDMVTSGYKDHLKRIYSQKAYAGSSFVEVIAVIESSNAKLREIRKLAESYTRTQ